MTVSKTKIKETLQGLRLFFQQNDLGYNLPDTKLALERSVYLNLCRLGDYVGLDIENNVPLYKFTIHEHVEGNNLPGGDLVNYYWDNLIEPTTTNRNVLEYFCLANDYDHLSVHKNMSKAPLGMYDPVWFKNWLETPISKFVPFGLSQKHADNLFRICKS